MYPQMEDIHGQDRILAHGAQFINHGGDPGVAIGQNGRLILNHIGSIFPGVYSHYSDDMGQTWSNAFTITSQQPEDKGTTTIDNQSGSPYYGRAYTSWVNYLAPFPVLVSYSSDNGQTWISPKTINGTPPTRSSGGSIKTGIDGKVYVTWAGMTASAPFKEDYAGFAYSTDGGTNWNVNQNIFDINGITGTLPQKNNIRVNSLPQIEVDKSNGPRKNWLYIVTTDTNLAPAGHDPDIILHRSTDGGTTWSSGIRVNQDPLNDGKIQYFPAMDIDEGGGVNIIFYDDRYTTSDSAEVMLARSNDGGNTWNESLVSDHRFQPKPIFGGSSNYQGDRISLISIGSKLHAFWMDDYSGTYQIWSQIMDINISDVADENSVINNFKLFQNYPNPFNPSTEIEFRINKTSFVSLKVYDLLGNEVSTLVNETKSPGSYKVNFNSSNSNGKNISSGIYFYQIKAGGYTQTRKMILLK